MERLLVVGKLDIIGPSGTQIRTEDDIFFETGAGLVDYNTIYMELYMSSEMVSSFYLNSLFQSKYKGIKTLSH